jgi:hypothetical protein
MGSVLIDRTGEVHGRLTVVERGPDYVSPKGKVHVRWWCRCSCPEAPSVLVTVNQLRDGSRRSCGCLRKEITSARVLIDLTGLTFGSWTVIARAGTHVFPNGSTRPLWEVVCRCGTRDVVMGSNLRWGQSLSCGCTRDDVSNLPSYATIHSLVTKERGSAWEYRCVDCGAMGREWAYNHEADIEVLDEHGLTYSLSVWDYEPRCKPCHWAFDH